MTRRDETNSIHLLRALLPGLALVGFTIGTGSVTSMVKAGPDYGMELLWALVISCVVTYFLFESFGRLTLVTGKTMLRAVWEDMHPALAVFICFALTVNVSGSIMGVMGIVADVLSEWSASLSANSISPTVFAGVLSLFIFAVLVLGNTKSLQSILALLAGVMGVCFLLNALRMLPAASALVSGLIPHFPNAAGASNANGFLVTASMVGTTVAPIVLVFAALCCARKAGRSSNWRCNVGMPSSARG
jgi:Mn2+/Fe2+ NRAMP family transporter